MGVVTCVTPPYAEFGVRITGDFLKQLNIVGKRLQMASKNLSLTSGFA